MGVARLDMLKALNTVCAVFPLTGGETVAVIGHNTVTRSLIRLHM